MIPLFYVVAAVIVVLVTVLVHKDFRTGGFGSGLLGFIAILLGVIALLGWGLVCLLWMPWALGGGA